MCGIFGLILTDPTDTSPDEARSLISKLFAMSESRGKEASGLAVRTSAGLAIAKEPLQGRRLLRTQAARTILSNLDRGDRGPVVCLGHTRMVTNGDPDEPGNNQPVAGTRLAIIHNGIITNEEALWAEEPDLPRTAEVDTEVMLRIAERNLAHGADLVDAVTHCVARVEGGNTFAILDGDTGELILATANGSLYWAMSDDADVILFASEADFLSRIVRRRELRGLLSVDLIRQLDPNTALVIRGAATMGTQLKRGPELLDMPHRQVVPGVRTSPRPSDAQLLRSARRLGPHLTIDTDRIAALRRCSRCILPETFPGLRFDEQGVCSICLSYRPEVLRPVEDLIDLAGKERRVLVPLSGGRDSCYGLNVAVKDLGFDVIAYTYDWGMVTDLARRNISRMCGALGVEHILVSADIARKRRNVQRNVEAWLRRPHLGTVPLFMSGDKQFFLHAQRLRDQLDLSLVLLSANPYERTDFKVGFAGVRDSEREKERGWDLSTSDRFALLRFYGAQMLRNPAYLNPSLLDTAHAFMSYYLIPKRFESLFDHVAWHETTVEDTLLNTYGWETSPDTKSTWRIGDGTAPFYNYIYLRVAGITENDTLRSNQIRAGHITRDEALRLTTEENVPRTPSLAWYFERIGVDGVEALRTINRLPTLY